MVLNPKITSATKDDSSGDKVLTKKKEDPLLSVDGKGFNLGKVGPAQDAVKSNKVELNNDPDDFYGRLRDMYNKPPTSSGKKKTVTNFHSDITEAVTKTASKEPSWDINSLTADVKKLLHKLPKDKSKKQKKYTKSEEKIKYKRSQNESIECKTVHYEEPVTDPNSQINLDPDLKRKLGGINEEYSDSDENDPEDKFPETEDLPDDPDALERIFFKYVDKIASLTSKLEKRGEVEPGTKESVRNCKYKMDNLQDWSDPTKAVTGIRKCTCPDTVVVDGDTAQLQDIKVSVKELKSNHNVGTVVVKMKKGNHTVDESVDTSAKLKEYKGPALLSKYALEILCCQISKHPCLGGLVFENVPLPSSAQTLLIPAFANLNTLKMVGTKLGDEGVAKFCRFLRKSKNLTVIDFTDNGITPRGAEHIAKLIERKGLYKVLEVKFLGLERVTLNKNPIRKEGMISLLRALQSDLFMKALDMRECDIEATASEVLDYVSQNLDLNVLDLRGNRVQRIDLIIKNILMNCPMEKTAYKWDDDEEIKKYL